MEMQFKNILLQKGLERLSEYQFRKVKSLLASELELSENMREDYDRINLADRMFARFPGATCIVKLINILKDDSNAKDIVSLLRKEKQNATKRLKSGADPLQKKRKGDGASTSTPTSSSEVSVAPQNTANTPVFQKKKKIIQDKTGMHREQGHQESTVVLSSTDTQLLASPGIQLATNVSQTTLIMQPDTTRISPATPSSVNMVPQTKETPGIPERAEDRRALAKDSVTVMVLKCSESFSYESTEQGTESMFHALVATTNHYFWVKVLDMSVKECFKKNSVLIISGHSENRGILEVSRFSSVFLAHDQIQVPSSVMRKAREIPKIASIKATPGIFVYGLYELVKKTENKTNTVYEIRDETGNIDVVGSGQWHKLPCEAGDKLHLFCLRLRTINQKPTLKSEKHSLIQVVRTRKNQNRDMQVQVMTFSFASQS